MKFRDIEAVQGFKKQLEAIEKMESNFSSHGYRTDMFQLQHHVGDANGDPKGPILSIELPAAIGRQILRDRKDVVKRSMQGLGVIFPEDSQ